MSGLFGVAVSFTRVGIPGGENEWGPSWRLATAEIISTKKSENREARSLV